ncbi:MAG: metal-dependent hydrolase [Lachnospira sp.]|nr:metal-dependent hydrolase [Lachnospira sp.]
MIIDFHTHIFPDKIVKATIEQLENRAKIKAFSDGTLKDLQESMKEANVDYSVVLPVATKPSQFKTLNDYAAEISKIEGIISFGGIHPDTPDYKAELDYIKSLSLKGIKLHPDYQHTFVDDEKILRIVDYAAKLDLIVSFHAGLDIGLPEVIHCPPNRSKNLLNALEYDKIVLAHTGGFAMWDEVEEYIVGKNVYLDISYSLGHIDDEQFVRIVRNHGVDKVLFATDSPWGGQKNTIEHFNKLAFTDEEKEKIFSGNARKLLHL